MEFNLISTLPTTDDVFTHVVVFHGGNQLLAYRGCLVAHNGKGTVMFSPNTRIDILVPMDTAIQNAEGEVNQVVVHGLVTKALAKQDLTLDSPTSVA